MLIPHESRVIVQEVSSNELGIICPEEGELTLVKVVAVGKSVPVEWCGKHAIMYRNAGNSFTYNGEVYTVVYEVDILVFIA